MERFSCGLLVVDPLSVDAWASESKATLQDAVFRKAVIFPGFVKVSHAIGQGQYGKVYKAIDPSSMDPVAIKVNTKPSYEAALQKKCSHANVCNVRATQDNIIVMDYSDNDLASVRGLQLTEPALRNIATQIICGIRHIHNNDIAHRDMKPHNILIDHHGAVRITDFGMADVIGADGLLNSNPDHIVTESYRPPDLLMGATSHTLSVDMWGIGCILAELVFGSRPFKGKNKIETLANIIYWVGLPPKGWEESFPDPGMLANAMDIARKLDGGTTDCKFTVASMNMNRKVTNTITKIL